ncbi:DNA polymerase III subunit gamma/tau [Hyphobacterium marinum]|uniref:DNA polymerase III subunit gamma/tau n=1 Tax=Hyphobacterium marinum TaxID=3116574 RepID=A0ABU7LW76_9PROT|nr:DNA polymerase III subunit gamma/tau [Hyphobacterium sp. Y6023]MEE2565814.1 DNA polymerase III subunit gamma/tau [Hyphobacterium sp. Y6023]
MDDSPNDMPVDADGPGLGLDLPEDDAGYQVLARKYRPARFEDLIGQEAMVRTLTNAFESGRIAHAYMLTGVRGIGKTTTARLIARALNYETDSADAPSITLDPSGVHCDAIARSAHVDVMEMDAASRTGVGDIREILEGVRYAPVSARFKVYIIDEVHMLSTAAFNALLKTLEEPPAHVKFIFATTEIRKVPVTVLSRCQRFDLKRIDRDVLAAHLGRIAKKEKAEVEAEGLALIARAAEGSVRDGLSLLDQAIVQGGEDGGAVTALQVRDMLGLADRARVLDLLEAALGADYETALKELDGLYDAGADPSVIARDCLDYIHAATRLKAAGPKADLGEPKDVVERLQAISERYTLAQLTRLWKILLTGLDDIRLSPDPLTGAEMTLLRLGSAANLPSPEDAARMLAGQGSSAPPAPAKPAPEPAPEPTPSAQSSNEMREAEEDGRPFADEDIASEGPSQAEPSPGPETFEALVALIAERRDIALKSDVERYVRLVSFKPGRIVFEPAKGAPGDIAPRLTKRLLEWTGATWGALATTDSRGGETIAEKRRREHRETLEAAAREPGVAEALSLFPGAEVVEVRNAADEDDMTNPDQTAEQRR